MSRSRSAIIPARTAPTTETMRATTEANERERLPSRLPSECRRVLPARHSDFHFVLSDPRQNYTLLVVEGDLRGAQHRAGDSGRRNVDRDLHHHCLGGPLTDVP